MLTGLLLLATWSGSASARFLMPWARVVNILYWWMDFMIALWTVFGLVLFVAEPLIVGPRLRVRMTQELLTRFHILHWALLIVSLLVIGAVVAGIYGVV